MAEKITDEKRVSTTQHMLLGRDLLICEGELDCLAALTCGIPSVGAPGASTVKEELVKAVKAAQCFRVILAFDNDAAGMMATAKWQVALSDCNVRRLKIPCGKDFNDSLIEMGKENLARHVNQELGGLRI